ncbi:MAG: hypothetical protein AB7T31_18880, partial [Gemmatimonadales bacterium]
VDHTQDPDAKETAVADHYRSGNGVPKGHIHVPETLLRETRANRKRLGASALCLELRNPANLNTEAGSN